MVKKYRTQCESNLYHVTTRGVARQIIFESDGDRAFFGKLLRENLVILDGKVYAWCFMENHVHLLFNLELANISVLMRNVQSRYASYFNLKYDRVGHLFQSRFDSVAIQDERQLLSVVRYIHRNPLDLGVMDLEEYQWSSYREYLGKPFFSSTDFVLELLGGVAEFKRLHMLDDKEFEKGDEWVETICAKGTIAKNERESDVLEAQSILGGLTPLAIGSLPKPQRDKALAELRAAGFTIAQISRMTGIGRNIIQRAR